ncbi:CoF synthetase [Flagellimonas sp.]|uniref:CoF synthetase n=1 Tax=Flagellimonas sp. TaxID=2058762 RepID=UPI003AB1BF90
MNHTFLNYLRNSTFWALDAIKGGKIKTNLKDIEASLSLDSFESLKEKNHETLSLLLDIAVNETEYYKHLIGSQTLNDFPVVNKNIIKESFDDILTKSSKNGKLHTISTSGSTGIPFSIYQNQSKKIRNTADTIYFAKQAGFTIGDKLLYLRLWNKKLKKKRVPAFLQNIVQINIEDLENRKIEKLINDLQKDKSPKGWLGYPSGLEKICDYLDSIDSKPIDCNVKSIIGMSEGLSYHVRSRMWYYFDAPMVSRYSNFENGILAQQKTNSDYFAINWASYIIEILDFGSNKPVKNGKLGRIVVTDLFNRAVPMIRYDTGDVGAMEIVDDHPFPVLKTVEGRKSDILLSTHGTMISPFAFMGIIPKYPEAKQIQFIQTDASTYTIKINIDVPFYQEQELVKSFKSHVGHDAEINIEYVSEIPLLNSKKRKITRNLYTERNSSRPKEKIPHS